MLKKDKGGVHHEGSEGFVEPGLPPSFVEITAKKERRTDRLLFYELIKLH